MSCPGTRPCVATGSTAASAGTATACQPRWKPRRTFRSPGGPTSSSTASNASTPRAGNRSCAIRASGRRRSPVRPGGSTSRTTTRPWTSPTWSRSCGRSSNSGTRGWSTRPSGSCPTRGAPRRRCPTSRSASTTPPDPGRTRPSPWPSTWIRLMGTPDRCGSWPGRPRRGRSRRTWPWPWAPTCPIPCAGMPTAPCTCWAPRRWPATRTSCRTPPRSARARATT